MSVLKQLLTITDEGTILISEIKETIELGKKDNDNQVGELFGDCWVVLEALVKQEVGPSDCLAVTNTIIERLEEKSQERIGSEKMRLNQLIRKLKKNVMQDYLQKII